MNFDRFERLILPMVIVLSLALGGAMTFATSLLHSDSGSGASAAGPSS